MLRALHSGRCKEDQAAHGNGFSFPFLSFPCPCSRKDFASHVICIFIEKACFTFMRAKNVQEGEASKKLVKRFFFSVFLVPNAPEKALRSVPQCLAQISSSCVQCHASQGCFTVQRPDVVTCWSNKSNPETNRPLFLPTLDPDLSILALN